MRIALISHQWPGVRLGGIGVYTLAAARMFACAGHEPHIFTLKLPDEARVAVPADIVVHDVSDLAERAMDGSLPGPLAAAVHAGGQGVYRLALGALLCEELRRVHAVTPFDIAEAPEYEALSLPLLLSPIEGLPVVTHIHSGSAVVRLATGLEATDEQLLIEALEAAALLAADGRCAPSRQVIADTRKGCPVADVQTLSLPFEAGDIPYTDPPTPLEAPILFIGRLETIKGAHLLPEALNIFLEQHPAARIRLAGPDTATAPLPEGGSMAKWMRANLRADFLPRVGFLGEQTQAQLAEELRHASFVIVPSLAESYSYVCCEAMAAGRPIVVSGGIGATDVVGDAGVTFRRGDAVDLAETMHRLFEDRTLQMKLAETGYQRIRTVLGTEAALQQRLEFYAAVIERTRAAGHVALADSLSKLPARYAGPLVQALGRLTTFLAGVPDPHIQTPGMMLTVRMEQLRVESGGPAKVVLYGAGRHTSRLLAEKHLWEKDGHRVVGLIDDHPRFQTAGATHLGLPVLPLSGFLAGLGAGNERPAVVLSTDAFQEQFWQQTGPLREAGVRVLRLYD